MKIVKVEGWSKDHIVKREGSFYFFYCKRDAKKDVCDVIEDRGATCSICLSLYRTAHKCSSGNSHHPKIGDVVQCPHSVSETGKIKIVADQSHCEPNTLQPGVSDWYYKAVMFDPDHPNEYNTWFDVTKKEIEEWQRLYK